jgi:DNA helicase-2/ATP-dependent DNA helicase PcrA
MQRIVQNRKSDVVGGRQQFWDEMRIDVNDIFNTSVSIEQQRKLVTAQETSYLIAQESLRKLERQADSPYFGRLDFVEEGEGSVEQIYIGILSFFDEETGELLVYDWRAPISGMFYDYPAGPADYVIPDGSTIQGNIQLKRQYVIKGAQMQNMFDTGLHIGDEMLQHMLGKSADDKMKSIVTTIQREQNQIIRDDKHKVLIVQGAAGSGKTSVALQRVAYLLYKHRTSLRADHMILFSPNPLFNDYVSTVLPELGESNMKQTTFQEYVELHLGEVGNIEDAYSQLEYLLTAYDDPCYACRVKGIEYKASPDFIQIIDRYAAMLGREGVVFAPFTLGDQIVISAEKLEASFYKGNDQVHLSRRVENIADWVVEELDAQEEESFKQIYRKMLKHPTYLGTEKELKSACRKRAKKKFVPLKKAAVELAFIDKLATYRRLFEDRQLFESVSEGANLPDGFAAISAYTLERLKHGDIPNEDTVPLLYLKERIEGRDLFNEIKHVIIDEAQDYSPFQYEFIKKLFPRSRFTLLGDINQGIYAHSNLHGYDPIRQLFGEEQTEMVRLTKSYRSTTDIVELTKAVLPQGEPVEAFSRQGGTPLVICVAGEDQLAQAVARDVKALADKGVQSIAILCKTERETAEAYESLKELIDVHLITKRTKTFVNGVLVIPSYLAKGLEFDGVIVYNAGSLHYSRESERKLFYTALTRAMHHLHIFYTGELTPFLSETGKGLYESVSF